MSIISIFLQKRFLLFLLFGGTAALVNLGTGWLLYATKVITLPYFAAVALAAFSGMVVNFTCNFFFNFRFQGRSALSQLRTFIVVSTIGVFLTSALADAFFWLFKLVSIQTVHLPCNLSLPTTFIAHLLSVGCVTVYSYIGHYYLSFNMGIRAKVRALFSVLKTSSKR